MLETENILGIIAEPGISFLSFFRKIKAVGKYLVGEYYVEFAVPLVEYFHTLAKQKASSAFANLVTKHLIELTNMKKN